MKAQKNESKFNLTYYGTGAVVAIGFLCVTSYYVYQSKTPKDTPVNQPKEALDHQCKETPANKFVRRA